MLLGPIAVSLPSSAIDLVSRWLFLYPHDLSNKNLIKTTWMWIPRFISWKIWLERNNRVFREESRAPAQVAIKARVMLSEALKSKALKGNKAPLSMEEDQWFKEFQPHLNSNEAKHWSHKASWEIRLESTAMKFDKKMSHRETIRVNSLCYKWIRQ